MVVLDTDGKLDLDDLPPELADEVAAEVSGEVKLPLVGECELDRATLEHDRALGNRRDLEAYRR